MRSQKNQEESQPSPTRVADQDREDEEEEKNDQDLYKITEAEEEDVGPIDMAQLRVSIPTLPNDFKKAFSFFEQILKDQFGEAKFGKAMKMVEEFKGDSYLDEKKLIRKLREEIFRRDKSFFLKVE